MPERLDSLDLADSSFKKIQKCVDKVDKDKIKETRNSDQLFDYILEFWSHQIFNSEEQFKEILNLLVSTQKGLTKSEILSISKVDPEDLKLFFTIFRPFIMNFQSLWMIKNDSFKMAVSKKYDFVHGEIN